MTGTLSVEVERYFVQAEHLRMVYEETKYCLAEVDYEHHFDKGKNIVSDLLRQRFLPRPGIYFFYIHLYITMP